MTILSVSSNNSGAETILSAIRCLEGVLDEARTAGPVLTEAVGMGSDAAPFHNAIVIGRIAMPYDELRSLLKAMEREAGRTPEGKARGRIPLDIDIMQHGDKRCKPDDWQRSYNIHLLSLLDIHVQNTPSAVDDDYIVDGHSAGF